MKRYALLLIGLLVLAGCKKIDDIEEATAVPPLSGSAITIGSAAVSCYGHTALLHLY